MPFARSKAHMKTNLPAFAGFLVALVLSTTVHAQITVLDFDDGTVEASINDFYARSGVVFSNATWFPNISCNTGQPFPGASPGAFVISRFRASSNNNCPQIVFGNDPIIAIFSNPVTYVSVTALDLGDAGARLDAYDAPTGGNLVATNEVYGGGLGIQNFVVLTNSAASIRRVEFYQASPNGSDGTVFDTLTFSPGLAPFALNLINVNGQMQIRLNGAIGTNYVIQSAENLSPNAVWTDMVTNAPSAEGFFDLTDTQAVNAARMYRGRML